VIPNLLLGAAIAIFAGYFLLEAAALPARARMFPQAILWGIAIVGILIAAQAVPNRLRDEAPNGTAALASASSGRSPSPAASSPAPTCS
jgi:hypothetical protein